MDSQCFLGADLSLTGTGLCLLNTDYTVNTTKLISFKASEVIRLFLNKNEVNLFLDDNPNIQYCCIEGPSFGSKDGGRLFQIGEWTGIFKLCLYERGIPFFIAVPSQVKKYISGTGKDVKKELILLDVYKKYNVEFRDNNIADAYVLSRICRDYYFLKQHSVIADSLYKYQLEVLLALQKTYSALENNPLV